MLNVSGATVERLVELALEFHAQDSVEIDDDVRPRTMDDDLLDEVLEGYHSDPFLEQFRVMVADLEPDQQQDVVALMWIGRGDFSEEELEEARELARDEWTPRTADYLIAHPFLADHLRDGLEAFGIEPEA